MATELWLAAARAAGELVGLTATVSGGNSTDPQQPSFVPKGKHPFWGLVLCLSWAAPALIFWVLDHCLRTRRRVDLGRAAAPKRASGTFDLEMTQRPPRPPPEVAPEPEAEQPEKAEQEEARQALKRRSFESEACIKERVDRPHAGDGGKLKVLLAALEHEVRLKGGTQAKVTAGGLGKVVGLIAEHHPTDITMVHPMIAERSLTCAAGHSYRCKEAGRSFSEEEAHAGEFCLRCAHNGRPERKLVEKQDASYARETLARDPPLTLTVDGTEQVVEVFRAEVPGRPVGRRVTFLLLSHPLFERRTKAHIYPNPMTRRDVLRFYSLWSQAVAAVLVRERPTVFHCPDFHASPAVLYVRPQLPDLKVLLCLHNAEYQGQVTTDQLRGDKLDTVGQIFNVSPEVVRDNFVREGRFNMLKPALRYIENFQRSIGVSAVSAEYAAECHTSFSIFWALPSLRGINNPMLEAERPQLEEGVTLTERKAQAKAKIQELYGLAVDPQAKLFVSLGRMVRQKGVDILADIAPGLLKEYPHAQLIVIGPPSDGFGVYAAQKLSAMLEDDEGQTLAGRVYLEFAFVPVGADLKFAADFCIMPSRDEPFGYVDVEFAWHGGVLVGAEAGGLGKVPGFYYRAQNRENLPRLRRELRRAVREAMEASTAELGEMQIRAREVAFPVAEWQDTLLKAYCDLGPSARREEEEVQAELATPGPLPAPRPPDPETPPFCSTAEFLKQELSEDELTEAMKVKILRSPTADIIDILDSIGLDQIMKYEEEHGYLWGKWLAERSCWGVSRVHWLVACGYVVAPVANTLGMVMCTEWGLRGAILAPKWLVSAGGVDAVVLNGVLFSINALGTAIGTPIWANLCKRYQPRYVLAAALLLQVPLNLSILIVEPRLQGAALIMFAYGLASGAGLLFIVFNFMLSVQPDMSHAAIRMGLLEVIRYVFMWLATAYVFCVSPTSLAGTADKPLPNSVVAVVSPLLLLATVGNLTPGLLLLAAPGGYRDDRFPGWDFRGTGKNKAFLLICASDVVGAVGAFASSCYVMWWMANGWSSDNLTWISLFFAACLVVGTSLWAVSLSRASVHGFSFLIASVTLFFPPAGIRAIAMEEASTWTDLGVSDIAMAISMTTLFYEGVRSSAMWTAKIKMLNSNWRLLSCGTVLLTVMSTVAAATPWLNEIIAQSRGTTFISRNQKELANSMVLVLAWVGLAQAALQVLSLPWIHQDLGIIKRQGDRPATCLEWMKSCSSLCFAVVVAGIFFGLLVFLEHRFFHIPEFYDAVNFCADLRYIPECEHVLTETIPTEAVLNTWTYGLNRYGQSTTARYNCRMRTLNLQGDTFIFTEATGTCTVQKCGFAVTPTGSELNVSEPIGTGTEVWSRWCKDSGRNLVAIHLFEWRWADVANECEQHLAHSGVGMVQISPVAEHVLGDSWATRYQPVSYQLDSRGGSREEFIDMVGRCRRAGVQIMADVILNHMAGPYVLTPKADRGKYCGQEVNSWNSSKMPCVGWNGTYYGNRQFLNNKPGLDRYTRKDFHHYDGNDYANCGLPPWSNNRHLCDLNGLPDLNTESLSVQRMQREFLTDLFEIGVTMLRVDAAMLIYSESLAQILQPIPWDYVVQEYYPDQLGTGVSRDKAFIVGHVTDFTVGIWLTQTLLDSGSYFGGWQNRSGSFEDWFKLGNQPSSNCGYKVCEEPVRDDKALAFIDNHDSQRERWKKPDPMRPGWTVPNAQCDWDGIDIGNCRLSYKNGMEYSLAIKFMLAWSASDSVRIMSSYAWFKFDEGPPGVGTDSLHDVPTSPVQCRPTPTTSPVRPEYDSDPVRWNCEHRWIGVLAMVRFRQEIRRRDHEVHSKWSKEGGFLGFSIGRQAFVALSRGYNNLTAQGSKEDYNLTGTATVLPRGAYCNLAAELGPVPEPSRWASMCTGGPPLLVDSDGIILRGIVPSGGMVALLINYTTPMVSSWSEALAVGGDVDGQLDQDTAVFV